MRAKEVHGPVSTVTYLVDVAPHLDSTPGLPVSEPSPGRYGGPVTGGPMTIEIGGRPFDRTWGC